jgi:hypothetical protein
MQKPTLSQKAAQAAIATIVKAMGTRESHFDATESTVDGRKRTIGGILLGTKDVDAMAIARTYFPHRFDVLVIGRQDAKSFIGFEVLVDTTNDLNAFNIAFWLREAELKQRKLTLTYEQRKALGRPGRHPHVPGWKLELKENHAILQTPAAKDGSAMTFRKVCHVIREALAKNPRALQSSRPALPMRKAS